MPLRVRFPSSAQTIQNYCSNLMKEVYEKLLENLSNMTPEQKKEEWEELKRYNDIGPDASDVIAENMSNVWVEFRNGKNDKN